MKLAKTHLITLLVLALVLVVGFFVFGHKASDKAVFEKKQTCSQYSDQVNKKITDSGRVFEKDSFTVTEIFYSPKMDTCLYAYVIHTTAELKEIYSIDDLFGGSVYTGGLAPDAEKSFYEKIEELKK